MKQKIINIVTIFIMYFFKIDKKQFKTYNHE